MTTHVRHDSIHAVAALKDCYRQCAVMKPLTPPLSRPRQIESLGDDRVSDPAAEADQHQSKRRKGPALVLALLGITTIGFNETRLAGWTLSDVLFVATAGVIVTQLLTGRTRGLAPASMRRSSSLTLVGSIIMLSAGTLSSLWSLDPATSMSVILRYGWLTLAWFWILRSVVPDRSVLGLVLRALRAGALIGSVVAILSYVGLVEDVTNTSGRQSAFFNHANALAGYLAMSLPFFVLGIPAAWTQRERSSVRTHLLPSGIVVFALATTGSMTAAGAAMAGTATVGLLLVTRGKRRRRRRRDPLRDMAIMAGVVIAIIALSRSGTQLVERYTEYSGGDAAVNSSASFREEGARFVLERFDESLVVGTGFDRETAGAELDVSHKAYGAGGSGIHNMLLKMHFEGGTITVLGFTIIILSVVQQAWRIIGSTHGDELQSLAIALVASLVSLNVLAMFQPMGFERFYWLPVGLIGVLWAVRRRELEHAAASTAPPRASA
jgi:hypothetical protein